MIAGKDRDKTQIVIERDRYRKMVKERQKREELERKR